MQYALDRNILPFRVRRAAPRMTLRLEYPLCAVSAGESPGTLILSVRFPCAKSLLIQSRRHHPILQQTPVTSLDFVESGNIDRLNKFLEAFDFLCNNIR
jgi:hypothetical protein